MKFNTYQEKVIAQLTRFLELLNETNNSETSFVRYWNEQGIAVGVDGIAGYKNTIKNTPHICFKVPTGGGKTYLACGSIKPVFDSMPLTKSKVVVWLVPSTSILDQTIKNLKNTNHPYRQKLDVDFNGRVEVYTKDQLLVGHNFSPSSVNEQLTICVLSFDSFRSNDKYDRKVYQQNGNLDQFTKFYTDTDSLIEGIDDSALIQVINQLSPVVIVDESHNATSALSIEMIMNINPSFVIDLTATPRDNSNIISYVSAMQLKIEHMVKLPVIVYNRHSKDDVIRDAIELRGKLEVQAGIEQVETGRYIRPIVLFQAQPNIGEDSVSFEKIKLDLVSRGIPSEYIAIKTSGINELKGVDLFIPTCKIRYIITVNALKEGWDCSFAYILATLANKTSKVDVEQVLGRVLRQPYAKENKNPVLNMSYVLTSSNDFRETLANIIKGLTTAGFTGNEFRAHDKGVDIISTVDGFKFQNNNESTDIKSNSGSGSSETELNLDELSTLPNEKGLDMFNDAIVKYDEYIEELGDVEDTQTGYQAPELKAKMHSYKINGIYKDELKSICLPQFFIRAEPNLFITDNFTLLTKERLSEGFTLKNSDTKIKFDTDDDDIVKIDINATGTEDAIPKYSKLSPKTRSYIKSYFSTLTQESKLQNCTKMISDQINKINTVDAKDLDNYIARIISNMTKDQIDDIAVSVHTYVDKIKKKILSLQSVYLKEQFDKLLVTGDILCKDNYHFSDTISPLKSISSITKSLYTEEEYVNDFEYKVIMAIAALDNIRWWHRNIDRRGFCINGYINHYADFIVMTTSGKIVVVETKGDFLDGSDSVKKVSLGQDWQNQNVAKYKYFMVFETRDLSVKGSFDFDSFMDLIKHL